MQSGDIYLDKYSGWYSVSVDFYDEDEIEEKNGNKSQNLLALKWNGLKKSLTFLSYLRGKKKFEYYKK